MLDIGFFEILMVCIVAILALGPDKLPQFAMDAVKMFKALKKAITSAQDSIESEINIADMQADMQKYQDRLDFTQNEIKANNSKKKSKKEIKKLEKTTGGLDIDALNLDTPKNKKNKKTKKENKDA